MTQSRTPKKHNQAEIAQLLGLSQSAVSLTLNNPETKRVSADKKAKILEYLDKLNYYNPHRISSRNIVFLGSFGEGVDKGKNPFWKKLFPYLKKEAKGFRREVIMEEASSDLDIEALRKKGCGIILACQMDDRLIRHLQKNRLPVVSIRHLPIAQDVCDVVIPHYQMGLVKTVEKLAKLGHTRIAYLTEEHQDRSRYRENWEIFHKLTGFEMAMRYAGLEIDRNLIHIKPKYVDPKDYAELGIERSVRDYKEMKHPPTAVICFNDIVAESFVSEAQKANWSVPDDISVIGMDDLQRGKTAPIKIMSLSSDYKLLAQTAIDLLEQKITKKLTRGCAVHLTPCELLEGNSVRSR